MCVLLMKNLHEISKNLIFLQEVISSEKTEVMVPQLSWLLNIKKLQEN